MSKATFSFAGKRVLVTGAANGLGKTIVEKFRASGAQVFALDKDKTALEKLPKDVTPICADLMNWDECKKAVEAVAPIHHLVNNAGIAELSGFMDISSENVRNIFGVNFNSYIPVTQAMVKGLKDHGVSGGTVVNISSVLDSSVRKSAGLYTCTKAAVTALTKVMATELAPFNVRVNCIKPTLMETNILLPKSELHVQVAKDLYDWVMDRQVNKRLLTVEETANSVMYLSSDSSSMVTGTSIAVDGGISCT